jgi:membrane protease YdiL (CAAX protease family)
MKRYWVKAVSQSVFLVAVATWISDWGIGFLVPSKLPVSHFWKAMIYRGTETFVWFLVMWALIPRVMTRFGFRGDWRKVVIGLVVVAYMQFGSIVHINFHGDSIPSIFEAFVFSLSIGFAEEFFSRGFIFGILEKYGMWTAVIGSSIHFGALHIMNIPWGGYSVGYTIGQVIDAAAFGVFACGLMLFTKTIWLPILAHGLTDLPMQFMTRSAYTSSVTGSFDWVGTFLDAAILVVAGWALIQNGDRSFNFSFGRVRKYFLLHGE